MPKRNWQKHQKKTSPKSILASPNLPKSMKSHKISKTNEACFATLCNPRASRRKLTGVIAFGPPIWLRIWLGLLDLPLVALIIEISPSTWNVSLMLVPSKPAKKISKNHSKILPKSIPNLPKLLQHRIEISNAFQMRPETKFESIFRDFFKFFEGPRPPKIEPRSSKSGKKTLKNRCWKKTCFWERFCIEF